MAAGSPSPVTASVPNTVVNGDFTNSQATIVLGYDIVGDGINEDTTWTLNFNPGYASFDTASPLGSALLTLTLTPGESFVSSDTFAIAGLSSISDPAIQGLSVVGSTRTVQIQLLDYYTSTQIITSLNAHSGRLDFVYQDDAVVSFSKLRADRAPPEPSTIAMIASALPCGLVVWLRRRRARPAA